MHLQVLMKTKAAEMTVLQAALPGGSPDPGGESLQWPEDLEEERAFAAAAAELAVARATAAAAVGPLAQEEDATDAALALLAMGAASGSAEGAEGSGGGAGKVSLSIDSHGANRRSSGFIPKHGGIAPEDKKTDRPISTKAERELFAGLLPQFTSKRGEVDYTLMRTMWSQVFFQQLTNPALDPQKQFVDPQMLIYTKSRKHLEDYKLAMGKLARDRDNALYNQALHRDIPSSALQGTTWGVAAAAAATAAAPSVPAAAATAAAATTKPSVRKWTQMAFNFNKRPATDPAIEPATKLQRGSSSAQPGGSSAQPGGSSAQAGGSSAQPGGSSAQARGSSAQACGSSAQAGGSSAQPGDSSAQAGGSSAQAGGSSAQACGSSAQAGGSSAQPGGFSLAATIGAAVALALSHEACTCTCQGQECQGPLPLHTMCTRQEGAGPEG
jgi:hypothetical protein